MSAIVKTIDKREVIVPLAEFLAWAGLPDPDQWESVDGNENIFMTIERAIA